MSIRALYSGKNSRYICGVCLDPSTNIASTQKAMMEHIKDVHPRTVVAWVCRNETNTLEQLPVQEGDGQDDDDDDSDAHAHADQPPHEDLSLRTLSHNNLIEWNMGRIVCDSLEEAVQKKKSISEMPKQHFVTCFFPCMVEGSICIAVEQYKEHFSYPTKGHCQSAIRHVIYNAIQLELEGILHANLGSTNMVDIHYVPKYCSKPIEFRSYTNFRDSIDLQQHQICECIDRIVGDRIRDEDYTIFRTRLLGSTTLVDLHSLLYSSYLTAERQLPVYYCSCRLLLHYTMFRRLDFNNIVEDFRKEWSDISSCSSQNQVSWLDKLRNSNQPDLIKMLDTRSFADGSKKDYDDSAFSNHEFIYNTNRHIKEKQVNIRTLEDMHKIMEGLFHEYPSEIWEYMHIHGLNAYFGPEEYAYGMLNLVNKLTNRTDKNFCFSSLLQALKMCCIMFAKFHNFQEKNWTTAFSLEFGVAASEIESCIMGLQSSQKEMHNCLLIRIKSYELTAVDTLVFKSIRIIVFALHFLQQLSMTVPNSTGRCILTAVAKTNTDLSKLSKADEFQIKILRKRIQALDTTTRLPSAGDTCKIAGLSFIISDGGRSSFSRNIECALRKLLGMLSEEKEEELLI